jgi:hypothetical protein
MILVAAALENASRGKLDGFRRQFAEGLHALKTEHAGREAAGLRDARAWEDALTTLYADAMRRRDATTWSGSGWQAPRVELA